VWALCGSLPPGVPADFYARLVVLVQEAGGRAFLDTSGEPLRLGCAAGPFLVKPNAVEAEEITDLAIHSVADAWQAATQLLRLGIGRAALSLGGDGLLLASPRESVWARPPRVRVLNTVGAGDALLAGLIWAMARGGPQTLAEMARWGVAVGTAAAMREGVSFGTPAEVAAVYERVRVETAPGLKDWRGSPPGGSPGAVGPSRR
jgi:1-phosphofructokinase family hexose kinase